MTRENICQSWQKNDNLVNVFITIVRYTVTNKCHENKLIICSLIALKLYISSSEDKWSLKTCCIILIFCIPYAKLKKKQSWLSTSRDNNKKERLMHSKRLQEQKLFVWHETFIHTRIALSLFYFHFILSRILQKPVNSYWYTYIPNFPRLTTTLKKVLRVKIGYLLLD